MALRCSSLSKKNCRLRVMKKVAFLVSPADRKKEFGKSCTLNDAHHHMAENDEHIDTFFTCAASMYASSLMVRHQHHENIN